MSFRMRSVPIRDFTIRAATWNPAREAPESEIDYIDIGAIDQDAKSIVRKPKIQASSAPSRARQIVRKGDVLVSTVRPNLNGVALVPEQLDGATASTGFCVLRTRADRLDSSYLFHWVKAPSFIKDMTEKATGQSYPAVSDRIVLDSFVPLPPLDEQRRIAAILDAADSLRAKRRAALAKLDQLAQSIFGSLLKENRQTLVETPLRSVVLDERHSFVNGPFGSDLLTSELQSEGVPVIYIRDIRDGEYRRVSGVHVTTKKADQLAFCAVSSGDLLVSKVGDPPGIAAIYPRGMPDAIVTQDVIRLRVDCTKADAQFLAAYLNSDRGRWRISQITVQATRARFSLGDFKKMNIDLPPVNIQKQFTERVQHIGAIRAAMRREQQQLEALFSSLQHRAFRGEL